LIIFIPANFGAFFMEDGIDTECTEDVDVFGTPLKFGIGGFESLDGVASGREGSVDFDLDEREEPGGGGPTGGGLDGSEGWSNDDDLEEPSF
jgi:hypothetical protein